MNEPNTYSEATIEQLTAENADLKKRVKELNAECEAQQYQFDILKKDPACVWANMLRGNIAIPSSLVEAHDYQQIKSERDELRAKLEQMSTTLTDYRTKPNCGEYGVTQGWIDRVDRAIS